MEREKSEDKAKSQSREKGQTRRKRDISIATKMLQKRPSKICMQEFQIYLLK